jgi:hypothetical protein
MNVVYFSLQSKSRLRKNRKEKEHIPRLSRTVCPDGFFVTEMHATIRLSHRGMLYGRRLSHGHADNC